MSKNETNTETIFEKYVGAYADAVALGTNDHDWIYERQASKNDKIKKMLIGASKKDGNGKGRPDFIIQSRKNPDFIIAVECKADTKYHESGAHDQYADYAVDGVLLYSSFLAKGFDVLSIAVSGETPQTLKISHFLQLKGEQTATPIFDDKLLPLDDYYNGYIKSPEKFRQDYQTLMVFSKTLNEKLHRNKIAEDERAFLLGCILIALENESFAKTYSTYTNAKQLAEYLVKTVRDAFENDKIGEAKLKVLDARFNLISTNTTLSKDIDVLKEIIGDIKDNIQDFIRTHEYFDVLGQLYIEFLRYANADKGLGIVLTPPHITEFMAEIAEVNKDSVVYDNCTGTGGFLVSAMSIMIKDAKGDKEKEKSIKSKQLIGVEYSDKIFPLACTNMFIHQDGKTNIYHGSCFDLEIIADVKTKNATVGLLNPPYKSDKKTDTDEYEFILANLECLQQGGRCVAIVPMQEALATSGKVYEFKKKVLKSHTLEAVFSMPDELFFNSKTVVNSCVMVFTAKRPHPADKEVYFGYYKDDGFVKRKNKGRIDLFGAFENEIKKQWITNYRNHKVVPGLSALKRVDASDEWCAEAYMDTDYSKMTRDDFQDAVNDYFAYLIKNSTVEIDEQKTSVPSKDTEIDLSKWCNYKVRDLFDIYRGKITNLAELVEGGCPIVSAYGENQGISYFADEQAIFENCLTASLNGSKTGYIAYHGYKFNANTDCGVLVPKIKLDTRIGIFIAVVMRQFAYRYAYGRKLSKGRLENETIKLPTTSDGKIDEKYIHDFMKNLNYIYIIK